MTRQARTAGLLDALAIVVFVAVGRRTHDEGGFGGLVNVAAPFLLALAAGWLITRAWRRPFDPPTGVGVWLITVAGGLLLRRGLFDGGTALAFVIVATLFLGTLLVGWRLIAERIAVRRVDRSGRFS